MAVQQVPVAPATSEADRRVVAEVSGRARRRAADAVVVAGWVVFVALWWRTLTYTSPATLASIAVMLVACVAVAVAGTTTWVVHNLDIHRRRGPRLAVPAVEVRLERDFAGRILEADWDAVRASGYVLVVPSGDRKQFRPVAGSPADAGFPAWLDAP